MICFKEQPFASFSQFLAGIKFEEQSESPSITCFLVKGNTQNTFICFFGDYIYFIAIAQLSKNLYKDNVCCQKINLALHHMPDIRQRFQKA